MLLYTNFLPRIPSSCLHIIPKLIPEAVLGTKEPSEKARAAAFGLLVAMGQKMNQGGVVKRNLVDGMDEDKTEDGQCHVRLYPLTHTLISQGKHRRVCYYACRRLGREESAHD